MNLLISGLKGNKYIGCFSVGGTTYLPTNNSRNNELFKKKQLDWWFLQWNLNLMVTHAVFIGRVRGL